MHRHTDWLTQRQTDGEKKTQQKTKKKTALLSMLVPYPLNAEGFTLKGSLVPASTR